jgi:hypothetical protein
VQDKLATVGQLTTTGLGNTTLHAADATVGVTVEVRAP